MTITDHTTAAPEAMSDRLFGDALGGFHLLCVHLGIELGLYLELDGSPAQTAAQLAARTGLDAWYVREWLQAERAAGVVVLDGDSVDTGTFTLAPGVREAIVDPVSPYNVAGLASALASIGTITSKLVDAFRTGDGVPYDAYGPTGLAAIAALNRPAYVNSLVAGWLPVVPDLLARLQDPTAPAAVADVGCGAGWSAIELASAFPHLTIEGFDNDDASIAQARANATARGVADRVEFEVRDITRPYPTGESYDLIAFFECLHDLGHPAEALSAARDALNPGGIVLVMEENVGDDMAAPGDPLETFFATVSVLWCLPQGRVDTNSTAIGTVIRPSTLRALATQAGFARVEDLPIEHPFFRFYRLTG
ncbi:MAG: class I SAM-dependent methyltransferase [Acidimicrobiales bacterium]